MAGRTMNTTTPCMKYVLQGVSYNVVLSEITRIKLAGNNTKYFKKYLVHVRKYNLMHFDQYKIFLQLKYCNYSILKCII